LDSTHCWPCILCPYSVRHFLLTFETTPFFVYAQYIQVSQEECARLREGVPYGKVYRYNPKHYVQSWTVTEIMAREKCGILAGLCTIGISWHALSVYGLECDVILPHTSSCECADRECDIRVCQSTVVGNPKATMTRVPAFL
jgi:hypothetical protein